MIKNIHGEDSGLYGFDEKFFKHTLFPYIVEKGEVISITFKVDKENQIKKSIKNLDLFF